MLIWFDNNGAIRKNLDYGAPARVGTTNFKIIAYFDGVSNSFDTATIKFIKPDYESSQYPLLFMQRRADSFTYDGESIPNYFQHGQEYSPVFEFDFAHFSSDQNLIVLLDTPGLWKAVITLYSFNANVNTQVVSVQGVATFNVQHGQSTSEGSVDADILMSNINLQLVRKLDIVKGIEVVSSIPEDLSTYADGQMLYVKDDGNIYEVVSGNAQRKIANEVISVPDSTTIADLVSAYGSRFVFSNSGKTYCSEYITTESDLYNFKFRLLGSNDNYYAGEGVSGSSTIVSLLTNTYLKLRNLYYYKFTLSTTDSKNFLYFVISNENLTENIDVSTFSGRSLFEMFITSTDSISITTNFSNSKYFYFTCLGDSTIVDGVRYFLSQEKRVAHTEKYFRVFRYLLPPTDEIRIATFNANTVNLSTGEIQENIVATYTVASITYSKKKIF